MPAGSTIGAILGSIPFFNFINWLDLKSCILKEPGWNEPK